jgi:hypothetical protein
MYCKFDATENLLFAECTFLTELNTAMRLVRWPSSDRFFSDTSKEKEKMLEPAGERKSSSAHA